MFSTLIGNGLYKISFSFEPNFVQKTFKDSNDIHKNLQISQKIFFSNQSFRNTRGMTKLHRQEENVLFDL